MRRFASSLSAALLLSAVPAFAEPAADADTAKDKPADCTAKVIGAFEKQRENGQFRMKTTMINQGGPLSMTVEYALPGRMRQTVKELLNPTAKPKETILVDEKAWTRQGGEWSEVPKAYTDELVKQMYDTVIDPPKDESFYACSGKKEFDGKELLAFRGLETIKSPDEKTKQVRNKVVNRDGAPVRMIYVDPTTGLPVRNTVATANRPDQPFFQARFEYPAELEIAPPENVVGGATKAPEEKSDTPPAKSE